MKTRTIKFRGKNLKSGEWVYGDLRHVDSETLHVGGHPVDPSTVGQYTGIDDSNGVHVYEGDVIDFSRLHAFRSVVRYSKLRFVCISKKGMEFIAAWEINEHGAVIGNVYDDPDLMKG